ncbi:hypothetical protein [Haloarcula marina]|uniref:hypothetical protein n=1 Tax=Haloarcula marina TaxID=2961574 RepID=UPI0020B73162|nr:hypothetical protein [Halomicroarcula marina]
MMQGPESTNDGTPICEATTLSEGGFADDTEILTTTGPRVVTELKPGDQVIALNPTTRVLKRKQITDIETIDPSFQCIHIQTRRSDLLVNQNHRIPYTTKSISRPRFIHAGELSDRENYHFLNDWQSRIGTDLPQVDITDLCTDYEINAEFDVHGHTVQSMLPDGCDPVRQNSHTGYFFDPATFDEYQNELEALADRVRIHAGPNHWRRPYRFDGDDFIEFIGWFVTEGSVTWKSASDTATIQLAQQTEKHRRTIAELFDRMNLSVKTTEEAFSFSSKLFGRLFERLCGTNSYSKRLPEFIWNCSPRQKRILFETMMAGDGNDWGQYYTHSDQLAHDIIRLGLEIGLKPSSPRVSPWTIGFSTLNDGFKYSKNVSETFVTGSMYQLAVEDFSTVMAGRNGKFQWAGVSAVA